ncbi:MAG: glycosyltransferase family 4 protein [Smithellaceae bacterium]
MGQILLLTKDFAPKIGGVPKYYLNLLSNLNNLQVSVITSPAVGYDHKEIDEALRTKNIPIIRVNCIPDNMGIQLKVMWLINLIRFTRLLYNISIHKKVQYIVVGQCQIFLCLAAYINQCLTQTKYILFLHGEEIPQIELRSNGLLRFLFVRAYASFCNSENTARKESWFIERDRLRVHIITPGVEDRFFEDDDASDIIEKYNLHSQRVLYTIARLDERKGHDMVIKALPLVLTRHPNVSYLIGGVGPRLEYLKALASSVGVKNHVYFLGLVPEECMLAYHKAGEVFVHPNRTLPGGDSEGFGIVFLEANAAGNPVIGGRSGGAVNAVEDGLTGLLVNPENPRDIAEKIDYLLSHDDEARRMGGNGRERAWKCFRWSAISLRFEQAMTSLILEI